MAFLDDIKVLLEADATLMSYLTGGIHVQTEISRQDTPAAFDANGEILPCCLINMESESPAGPYWHSSQTFFRAFFYERSGYATIDAARERVYAILHRVIVGTSRGWEVTHTDDMLGLEDQALDCSLIISRYMRFRMRV